jgi:hypothetical protein
VPAALTLHAERYSERRPMNTAPPIRPVERPSRQIGDLAKCAWCGAWAESAFAITDPGGGCFVSASAPHAARRRRKSEAGSVRFSASSTWLRRGSLWLGESEQWFHPLGRKSRGGGRAANVPSAGPDHPLSAPRRPSVPLDVGSNAQRRGSCPQHFPMAGSSMRPRCGP